MTSLDESATALFSAAYAALVRALQDRGVELRSSRLGNGVWVVYVVPRPLLTIRTRYDGHARTLSVHSRRLVRYVERYSARVSDASLASAVAGAVATHEHLAGHGTLPGGRHGRGSGERR